MRVLVWTEAYSPWIMGGDVHAPIGCYLNLSKDSLISAGRGFSVYVLTSPMGHTHIAESKSGAFVGESLVQVKQDVKAADLVTAKLQVRDALLRKKKVRVMSRDEFWGRFREEEA